MQIWTVYIVASRRNGTLYTGVTRDLIRRLHEHREGIIDGFTKKYGVKRLVYYENHRDAKQAITREKRIKTWKRLWKINLIEKINPGWDDLWDQLFEESYDDPVGLK